MASLSLLLAEMRRLDEDGLNIWIALLEAEKIALHVAHAEGKYRDPLVAIRLLGFLLKDLWYHASDWNLGRAPYSHLKDKIQSCRRTEDWFDLLVDMGLKYRNHILRVFLASEDHRSSPSPDSRHEPRVSFDTTQQRMVVEMKNSTCSTRKQALLRDGFRCAITGLYDVRSWDPMDQVPVGRQYSDTEAAYLFPGSVQDDGEASALSLFEMLGLENRAQSLCADSVNKLQNVITLETRLRRRFDDFEIWLEPVGGQDHTYDVCNIEIASILGMPVQSRITLRVDPSAAVRAKKEGLTLSLPDPLLIAIRAVCVRACKFSGATEHMELILGELEEATVLSNDGGMATLLASRLSMYMV